MKFGFGPNTNREQSNQSHMETVNASKMNQEQTEQQENDQYFDETSGKKPNLSAALSRVDEQVFVDDKTHVNLDLLNDELMSVEYSS